MANILAPISKYERYRKIKSLGVGHVHQVEDRKEKNFKAMKMLNKLDPTAKNECSLLFNIKHENIVKFYEHFDHEIDGLDYTFVITEFCEVFFCLAMFFFLESVLEKF